MRKYYKYWYIYYSNIIIIIKKNYNNLNIYYNLLITIDWFVAIKGIFM